MAHAAWELVEEDVFVLRDSCLVYAVRGPEGTVLVNAGTGLAAEQLGAVADSGGVTVLLTHHFRDHTDGAIPFGRGRGDGAGALLGERLSDRPGTTLPGATNLEFLRQPLGSVFTRSTTTCGGLDDGL